jgi:hypothetical protein
MSGRTTIFRGRSGFFQKRFSVRRSSCARARAKWVSCAGSINFGPRMERFRWRHPGSLWWTRTDATIFSGAPTPSEVSGTGPTFSVTTTHSLLRSSKVCSSKSAVRFFKWRDGRALEDELFTCLPYAAITNLLAHAIDLHGEALVEAHVKSASAGKLSLTACKAKRRRTFARASPRPARQDKTPGSRT